MQILPIFLGAAALFLLVRLIIQPMTERAVASDLSRRPKLIAVRAAVQTLSNLLFWLALSAGATLAAVRLLQSAQPATLDETTQALETLRGWISSLQSVSGSLGLFGACAAALGLLWFSYRRTQRSTARDIDALMEEEFGRISEDASKGNLESLPPSDAMKIVAGEFDKLRQGLADLQDREASEQDHEEAREELDRLNQLYAYLDVSRRAQTAVAARLDATDRTGTKKSKLATFFVSDGFHDSLSGVGKVLSIFCLMAVIPGSLVLTGPLALDELQTKRVALQAQQREFEFAVARGEINQAWEALVPPGAAASVTPEDEDIASELAQLFESNLVPNSVVRQAARSTGLAVSRTLRRETVRRSILSSVAARSDGLSITGARPIANNAVTNETLSLLSETVDGRPGPRTAIGKQMRADALEMARQNPDAWVDVKAKFRTYRASFGTAASPQRLQAMVINQAIGDVLGSAGVPDTFWSQQARRFGASITAEAATAYTEASTKMFLSEFSRTGDLSASANRAASRTMTAFSEADVDALRQVADLLPQPDDLARQVEARRAVLQARSLNIADDVAARAVTRSSAVMGNTADAANVLLEFSDFFPGYEGQDLETQRARTARKLDLDGAPPSRASASRAQLNQSRASVRRAGSFGRLRGFSRIGGVLIGRDAENMDPLRVDRFNWQIVGEDIVFDLAIDGQPSLALGPFDAATAHLALAYAADGRATTVTMVTAPPMPELRVLFHPAIEDTGLGCRARRLDQFADEVSSEDETVGSIRQYETVMAIGEVALYNLARDLQLVSLGQTTEGYAALESYGAASFLDYARQNLNNPKDLEAADLRLSERSLPLTIAEKDAYFDRQIVNHVAQCRAADTIEQFAGCVSAQAVEKMPQILSLGAQWLAPPVEYQTWSGVRERAYTVDPGLAFMTGQNEPALGPLRFMVQLAISSPAYFADPERDWFDSSNEAPKLYTDPDPWEFENTGAATEAAVLDKLNSSTEHLDVYSDMVEFTRLQRLFRAALDGPLSESFPLEELSRIADATRGFVNLEAPTIRWNSREGQIEANVQSLLAEVSQSSPPVEACIQLASGEAASTVPAEQWNRICSPAALKQHVSIEVVDSLGYLNDLRGMRFDLGLARDDALTKAYSVFGCPAP